MKTKSFLAIVLTITVVLPILGVLSMPMRGFSAPRNPLQESQFARPNRQPAPRGGYAWKNNFANPTAVNVKFQASFNALGISGAYLAGTLLFVTNNDTVCGATWMDTPATNIWLRPYQTYKMVLFGDNIYETSVTELDVPNDLAQLGAGNIGNNPQTHYRVYMWTTNAPSYFFNHLDNAWESHVVGAWVPLCSDNLPIWNSEADGDGNCDPVSLEVLIQVRPDGKSGPGQAEGEDTWGEDMSPTDADTAPGDGGIVTMASGKSADPSSMNIDWNVSLGRLWNGSSAGKLHILADHLNAVAFTPSSLNYAAASSDTNEVDVRMSLANSTLIQQIRTPQTLVDVQTLTTNSFALNFYLASAVAGRDTNSFFTLLTGSQPFVSWLVDSPDGTNAQWRLREVRNGITNATLLQYSNNVWSLARGIGSEAVIETRTIAINTTGGTTQRQETQQIGTTGGTISDRTVEVYQQFDWGFELVTVTNDPGGANLVTSFEYGTNSADYDHERLTFVQYPDGYWERRVYADDDDVWENDHFPGALFQIVHPWKDTPSTADISDCLVTHLYYEFGEAPGSYRLFTWYDPDLTDDEFDFGTYEERVHIAEDNCSSDTLITEIRACGIGGNGTAVDAPDWTATQRYGPYYGPLSGRLYCKNSELFDEDAFDYQSGQWNASTLTFTAGSSNDVQEIIYHGVEEWSEGGDQLLEGDSGVDFSGLYEYLNPFQSTKEVKIIVGGNLAAHETYIYTGDDNYTLIDQTIYQRDCLGHATNVFRIDPVTMQSRVLYQANWQGADPWPHDVKLSETDDSGTVTTYAYDSLKRVIATTKQGVSISGFPAQTNIVTTIAYDAAGRVRTNTTSAGSLSLKTVNSFDLAGRVTSVTTPGTFTTSYTYPNGGLQTNITFSSGATMVLSNYLDRRIASITGSAVTNQYFDYTHNNPFDASYTGINYDEPEYPLRPVNATTMTFGSAGSARWKTQIFDRRNFMAEEQRPAFGSANILYKNYGSLFKKYLWETRETGIVDLNGVQHHDVTTGFSHDDYGNQVIQSLDPNSDYQLVGLDSDSRASSNCWYYAFDGGGGFKVTEQYGFLTDYDATPTLVQRVKTRVTGFASNVISETFTYDADTNLTHVITTVDRANKKVTTVTSAANSTLSATNITVNGLLQTESTPSVSGVTRHSYDTLGRETSVTNALGFSSATAYDSTTGQVISKTDPAGNTTTFSYYAAGQPNAGQLNCETGPTGKKTYYSYNDCGQLVHTWGDVPYPAEYVYDKFGDLTELHTYRGGSGWTGSSWPTSGTGTADVTHWYYDEATGLLTNKTDAAGQSVTYSYYNNYLLCTRTWSRGVTVTNLYSDVGDLVEQDYSDGTPSVLFNNYNRVGQPREIIDQSGTNELTYDFASRLIATACTNGLMAGITVSNHFTAPYGRDSVSVLGLTSSLEDDFAYESFSGRLSSVGSGSYLAIYGYVPNSDLLQTTTFWNGGIKVLATTRSWDYGMRLHGIVNAVDSAPVTSHNYQYDTLNRRTKATLEDGSYWQYGYDDRDELTNANRNWSYFAANTPVSGQQFSYAYDTIGNRQTAGYGGDANGANLRTITYANNNLNQYIGITTPGYENIIGAALATSSVTVNGSAADRKAEYFHKELAVANSSGPIWQNITNVSGTFTNKGGLVFPANSQSLVYDADGNLSFDGIWSYQWDGENRLISMTMTNVSGIANSNRMQLQFAYDGIGRRVQKIVSVWNGSSFTTQSTNRYIYDGWNLLAVVNPQSSIVQSFMWGQDLSGTPTKAGGIGGLLMASISGTNCFTTYDGNGNVTALINAMDKSLAARYEYSPYGELIRTTGLLAHQNPFRFSTKFWDDETGLICYPSRYYSPLYGKWLGRDPIEEKGGINLAAFVANNPITSFDPFGKDDGDVNEQTETTAISDEVEGDDGDEAGGILGRVRALRDNSDDAQQLASDLINSATGDDSDLYIDLLQNSEDVLSKGIAREARIGGDGSLDGHHIFPQKFAEDFRKAGINVDDWVKNIGRDIHQELHSGRGFGKGGKWNAIWESVLDQTADMEAGDRLDALFGVAGQMISGL
jgi:RHS repeat-associated protein